MSELTLLIAAQPGLRVQVSAPRGTAPEVIRQVPPVGAVVAWTVEGDRVEPVFLAGGRAWTPAQFRSAFGEALTVEVTRA